jgi:hypothetical protein
MPRRLFQRWRGIWAYIAVSLRLALPDWHRPKASAH